MKVFAITVSNPEKTAVFTVGAENEEGALNLLNNYVEITDDVNSASGNAVDVDQIIVLPATAVDSFCQLLLDTECF